MTLDEFKQSAVGRQLQPLLSDATIVAQMEAATRLGQPAVRAIDEAVAAKVGSLSFVERQHVGRWVRDVLSRRGWRPAKQLDWRGGKVFKSGAVYARVRDDEPAAADNRFTAASRHRIRSTLAAGRLDPFKPLDTVDDFLAERRAMWGER